MKKTHYMFAWQTKHPTTGENFKYYYSLRPVNDPFEVVAAENYASAGGRNRALLQEIERRKLTGKVEIMRSTNPTEWLRETHPAKNKKK